MQIAKHDDSPVLTMDMTGSNKTVPSAGSATLAISASKFSEARAAWQPTRLAFLTALRLALPPAARTPFGDSRRHRTEQPGPQPWLGSPRSACSPLALVRCRAATKGRAPRGSPAALPPRCGAHTWLADATGMSAGSRPPGLTAGQRRRAAEAT